LNSCTNFTLDVFSTSSAQKTPLRQLLGSSFMSQVINLDLRVDSGWCSNISITQDGFILPSLQTLGLRGDMFGWSALQGFFRVRCPSLTSATVVLSEDEVEDALEGIDESLESSAFLFI
jgi:hypothetical protein